MDERCVIRVQQNENDAALILLYQFQLEVKFKTVYLLLFSTSHVSCLCLNIDF